MNQENRGKVILVLVLLLGGLGWLGYQYVAAPLLGFRASIDKLSNANLEKELQLAKNLKDKKQLEAWRAMSLPGVENVPKSKKDGMPKKALRDYATSKAQDEYAAWLRALLNRHKIKADPQKRAPDAQSAPPYAGNKELPSYTVLAYSISESSIQLKDLVALLKDFQSAPLLHRVKSLKISHAGDASQSAKSVTTGLLSVVMTVEALIVHGSRPRGDELYAHPSPQAIFEAGMLAVRRRPSILGWMPWTEIFATAALPNRKYDQVAKVNIFEGAGLKPSPTKPTGLTPRETPELILYAGLSNITAVEGMPPLATIRYKLTEQVTTLQLSPTKDTFDLVRSAEGSPLIYGKVLSIDARGVAFRVGLHAFSPEEIAKRNLRSAEVVHKIDDNDFAVLVEDKGMKDEEIARTYKIQPTFWANLIRDQVLRENLSKGATEGGRFYFRMDLVCGQILSKDKDWVMIQLDENYCSFRRGDNEPPSVRPHEGYVFHANSGNLMQALQRPLEDREIAQLLSARGASGNDKE